MVLRISWENCGLRLIGVRKMSELYRKMVEEAMAAQRADVETVKR